MIVPPALLYSAYNVHSYSVAFILFTGYWYWYWFRNIDIGYWHWYWNYPL